MKKLTKDQKWMLIAAAALVLYLLLRHQGPVETVTSGVSYGPPTSGTLSAAPTAPLQNIPVPADSAVQTIAIDPVTGELVPVAGTMTAP